MNNISFILLFVLCFSCKTHLKDQVDNEQKEDIYEGSQLDYPNDLDEDPAEWFNTIDLDNVSFKSIPLRINAQKLDSSISDSYDSSSYRNRKCGSKDQYRWYRGYSYLIRDEIAVLSEVDFTKNNDVYLKIDSLTLSSQTNLLDLKDIYPKSFKSRSIGVNTAADELLSRDQKDSFEWITLGINNSSNRIVLSFTEGKLFHMTTSWPCEPQSTRKQ